MTISEHQLFNDTIAAFQWPQKGRVIFTFIPFGHETLFSPLVDGRSLPAFQLKTIARLYRNQQDKKLQACVDIKFVESYTEPSALSNFPDIESLATAFKILTRFAELSLKILDLERIKESGIIISKSYFDLQVLDPDKNELVSLFDVPDPASYLYYAWKTWQERKDFGLQVLRLQLENEE